ncbi:MAG: hypothetical protein MUD08_11305 [Cytophagales bacterium]|jgi:hypothetical protein|nr:hypothetical protein [Cytophagales bacterium]
MAQYNNVSLLEYSSIAFELFRHWTARAKEDYAAFDFTILDEQQLASDLEEIANAALSSLQKKSIENRSLSGYDYGYFLGYVASRLNGHWYHEYIVKQKPVYKEFIALKAISVFLKQNILTDVKIQEMYKAFLSRDSNFLNSETAIEIRYTSEKIVDQLIEDEPKEDSPIIQALENRKNEIVAIIAQAEAPDYLPDLKKHFPQTLVEKLAY